MKFTELCDYVFIKSINDFYKKNNVDAKINNPFKEKTIEYILYLKNWIDASQWTLEDIIRNPNINPEEALKIKRRIDSSNQERTDLVELIDNYFLDKYKDVEPIPSASINTESPAWAIDRLSILYLKIFHMTMQTKRTDADDAHIKNCIQKLDVLIQQKKDLKMAIDELFYDISTGSKYMKTYKQMKMYNDPSFNPILNSKNDI